MDNLYECMVILNPELPDSEVASVLDHLKDTLTAAGGEFDCVNLLGKHPLAYEIAHHKEGIRALLYFRGGQAVAELKREMLVTPGVLRSMVVVANERAILRPQEAAEPAEPAEEQVEEPPEEEATPTEGEPDEAEAAPEQEAEGTEETEGEGEQEEDA